MKKLDELVGKVDPNLIVEAAFGDSGAGRKILAVFPAAGSSSEESRQRSEYAARLGEILESSGDLVGAKIVFEQALSEDVPTGVLVHAYASLLYEIGELNVSISKMKKIIDDNEGNGVLLDGDLAWIYDSIGQAEQGIGLLDSAIAAFSVSRQMAGLAARDGRFSQKELAWIYNDAAGPSIRKREYGEAKRFLCKSVATFKGIGDSTDRGLLSASLNLAVLLRELGEWGS